MYGNYIYKPLPFVAGKVLVRVFLNHLEVLIADIIKTVLLDLEDAPWK